MRNASRNLLNRRRVERELDDEVRAAFELLVDEKARAGMSAPDARRAAAIELGQIESVKEQVRDVRAGALIESLLNDFRYAVRILHRRPGASLAAAAMLAVAIGVTTAMFTLVDALILRPAPFRMPEDLARVRMRDEHGGVITVTPAVVQAWRHSGVFEAVESAMANTSLVEFDGSVAVRGTARVTPGIFDLLGSVRPVRGRLFESTDTANRNDDRVLISEDLWRSLFHHDPDIIGRRVTIDGQPATVVGILPADFRFPASNTVIWRPVDLFSSAHDVEVRATAFVRFARNMPRADAARVATAAAHAADPTTAHKWLEVDPLASLELDTYYQRALPILAGAVVLMFLVLCANVSSLLLARVTVRQREFSVRSALGASRARLLRQGLAESLLLGILAVVGGLAVGWLLVSLSRTYMPEAFLIRTLNPLDLDARALLVTVGAGLLATIAAGVLPAWLGSRSQPDGSLRVADRGATETRSARGLMRALLISEVALACVLLGGATLLVRSFVNLAHADRGLDSSGVITAMLSMPTNPGSYTASLVVARSIEDAVRALPGVRQATWSYGTPNAGAVSFGDWVSDAGHTINMDVEHYRVSAEFFALYRIPVLRGRSFEMSDDPGTVVVGERFARGLWPGEDPIGRSFSFGRERFHVIGVAREINHPSLDPRRDLPEYYEPLKAIPGTAMLSVRCETACPDPAVIRQRISLAQAGIRINSVRSLDAVYFEDLARPRASAALALVFAIVATLAAAGGLFSVLSYAVARRGREFGIRTALGASRGEIGRLVIRDGLTIGVAGLAFGMVGAWSLARVLSSLQYGITSHDPVSWMVVLLVLLTTTLVASWRPARHAMLVNPVMLLKDE